MERIFILNMICPRKNYYWNINIELSDIFPPQAHFFTKNKATWINLDDKIPFFERMYDRNKIWPKTSLDKLNTVL